MMRQRVWRDSECRFPGCGACWGVIRYIAIERRSNVEIDKEAQDAPAPTHARAPPPRGRAALGAALARRNVLRTAVGRPPSPKGRRPHGPPLAARGPADARLRPHPRDGGAERWHVAAES